MDPSVTTHKFVAVLNDRIRIFVTGGTFDKMKSFNMVLSSFLILLLLSGIGEGVFLMKNFDAVPIAHADTLKTKKTKKLKKIKKAKKTDEEAKACVDQYLKFTVPPKYVMNFVKSEVSPCPTLQFDPPGNYTFYPDESGKSGTSVFEGGPRITISFVVPQQHYLDGAFATEKKNEGAIMKTINGAPWYHLKLTGESSFISGESYESFVDLTQIRFTILLDTSDPGKDPKAVSKTTSDFANMMKTMTIRTDVPSRIEPVAAVTKEMLALSGTWKQIKSFSKEDLEAGFDQNPQAGSPVKAHLIAFRANKICYFIQEESPSKCYSGYVIYTLTGSTIKFNDGADQQWEILKNTASELHILGEKGWKDIFQKTAVEAPPDR